MIYIYKCNKATYKVTPKRVAAVSNVHVLYPYGNPYGNSHMAISGNS